MKQVAIVTIYDCNLGNRLQNYALQTYLKSMNMDVKTLKYISKKPLKIRVKNDVKVFLGMLGYSKYKTEFWNIKRGKKYNQFNNLYIKTGELVDLDRNLNINTNNYDYFVVGSDQVWHNWGVGKNELDYFYLRFTEEKKRISYAPSFGFSSFSPKVIDKHIIGLKGMRALSCREEDGCSLIKNTIGIEAIRLIDPSFLLTSEQWKVIEKKPKWFEKKEKLIVTYFLGNKPKEYLDYVNNLAKRECAQIVDILSVNNKNEYVVSPDEFIYLIDNADYVCTDSFHACAFSLIFNTKYIAFPRKQIGMEDMKGRINTLFSILNINSRWYTDIDDKFEEKYDYHNIIDREREKSNQYLKKYLV